ncbi:hypothetical protein C5167_039920 [Papaver somniferum]|uniref:Uncharacterized protein n=1 Tax=Papaver somniferum TaxID=3469 RepID=A0A4Y7IGX4_PAPSO|nr:protein RAE1-like [Papaver somniferum]RZC46970.1 hypothetical protein C5167_039920 [Papaver somniferum]
METSSMSEGLANPNPNNSFEVVQPPDDYISSLCFSPNFKRLAATSWDKTVKCWQIGLSWGKSGPETATSRLVKSIDNDQPVLCSAWIDDGDTIFWGGCDKQVKMWSYKSNESATVGEHDEPVKEIAWIPDTKLLATGSWDKTLRYWDLRQPTAVLTQQLPERCYALSVNYPLMVVGTADENLIVFDLTKPQVEYKRMQSPLMCQTRCVALFPDNKGFLVGSIEGRVGVYHLDDSQQEKHFSFDCHREGEKVYSVNSLNFHPVYHTFASAGSDGAFNFWDKDSKLRLKAMSRCNNPITCSAFTSDGLIYAYAVCYDWSKNAKNRKTSKPRIFLHLPRESEVKGKPPRAGKGRK